MIEVIHIKEVNIDPFNTRSRTKLEKTQVFSAPCTMENLKEASDVRKLFGWYDCDMVINGRSVDWVYTHLSYERIAQHFFTKEDRDNRRYIATSIKEGKSKTAEMLIKFSDDMLKEAEIIAAHIADNPNDDEAKLVLDSKMHWHRLYRKRAAEHGYREQLQASFDF